MTLPQLSKLMLLMAASPKFRKEAISAMWWCPAAAWVNKPYSGLFWQVAIVLN